jgi:hypothetical protein
MQICLLILAEATGGRGIALQATGQTEILAVVDLVFGQNLNQASPRRQYRHRPDVVLPFEQSSLRIKFSWAAKCQ